MCVSCALGRCSSSEELHKLPFPDNGLKDYQRLRVLGAALPAGPALLVIMEQSSETRL